MTGEFEPIAHSSAHDYPILCMQALSNGAAMHLLLTGASDGSLALWNLHSLTSSTNIAEVAELKPVTTLQVHQSGINCMSARVMDGDAKSHDARDSAAASIVIVSGGDDETLVTTSIWLA